MKRNAFVTVAVLCALAVGLLASCGGATTTDVVPAVSQTQFMPLPDDMHGARYCEIIPAYRNGLRVMVDVYVTTGLNDCPDEQWRAIDADALAEAYGAVYVKKNGPRYWLVNSISATGATVEGETVAFNGIEMHNVAAIEMSLPDLMAANAGDVYVERTVQRSTTYLFRAGTMVYELIAPNGDVYRMQSYAQIVDSDLALAELETLGERLDLPEGWQFQARTLDEPVEMVADGVAYVIQDELENSYQKVTGPTN